MYVMMTLSNGNIFRVTGPLWGDPSVTGGFPSQRPVMFSFIWAWTNGWANNRDAGDMWLHRAHHDVAAMVLGIFRVNMCFAAKIGNSHGVWINVIRSAQRDCVSPVCVPLRLPPGALQLIWAISYKCHLDAMGCLSRVIRRKITAICRERTV